MDYKTLLFSFEGRISRKPYWMFILGVIIVNIIIAVLAAMLGDMVGMIISIVVAIAMIWSGLAVSVKRWHDRDKSGWWVLIGLIPLIGTIWVLVECGFLRGTEGQNRFGADSLAGS
jgi:uncharacterized membrane protein YhaH (DUF805 family)